MMYVFTGQYIESIIKERKILIIVSDRLILEEETCKELSMINIVRDK